MSLFTEITKEIKNLNYRARLILDSDTAQENVGYIQFALWRTRELKIKRELIYGV